MQTQRLKDSWAKELLGEQFRDIQEARKVLKKAVDAANSSLKKSRIAPLVATEMGQPGGVITVDSTGIMLLSEGTEKAPVKKAALAVSADAKKPVKKAKVRTKSKNTGKREWKSDLPTLEELRAQAEEKGIDISHMGRKRKEILAFLNSNTTTSVKEVSVADVGQSSFEEDTPKRQTVVRRRRKKVVDLKTAANTTDTLDLDQILEG